MIGIKEIVGYHHDETDRNSSSMTERFLWKDSPLMIKLRRSPGAMYINFNQIPSKIIVIKRDKTEEYPGEQCHGASGLYIDLSRPYWNKIDIIFDDDTAVEYDIPKDTETLFADLTQYVESDYDEIPSYDEWSQAAALLDDDMLDI